jgi:hypothetical protein
VPDEWFTLRDAAIRLGVSEGAIRKRVARGAIRSQMGADGLRYVWLEGEDAGDGHGPDGGTDVLVEELRDRIAFLQRQLQSREEELRRRDAILMNMTEAMKALTPRVRSPQNRLSPVPIGQGPRRPPQELRRPQSAPRSGAGGSGGSAEPRLAPVR